MVKSLSEIYLKYSESSQKYYTDKGLTHNYIPIYEKHLTKRNNVDLLEIGIYWGSSILMWNDFFENSNIYGCDIDFSNLKFDLKNIYQIDTRDKKQVELAFNHKKFDYIIDDGDHKCDTQIKTFNCFWPYLKKNGTYFIEDIENDQSLEAILENLKNVEHSSHIVYDKRKETGQWDEIMVVINR